MACSRQPLGAGGVKTPLKRPSLSEKMLHVDDMSKSSSMEKNTSSPWPLGLALTNPSEREVDSESIASSHAHRAIKLHVMRPRVYSLVPSDSQSRPPSRRASDSAKILTRSDRMYFTPCDKCDEFNNASSKGDNLVLDEDILMLAHKRLSIATSVLDEVKSLLIKISHESLSSEEDHASRLEAQSTTPIYGKIKEGPQALLKLCQRQLSRRRSSIKTATEPNVVTCRPLNDSLSFEDATIVLFPGREKRQSHRLSLARSLRRVSTVSKTERRQTWLASD